MNIRVFLRWIGHIHWLRFGFRDQLIRFFYKPDTAVSKIFEIKFFKRKYIGDFSNFIDWSVYYYGAYNGEELQLMHDAIKGVTQPVIFDIGANVGHHTLFASLIAKEVHAFEPFPMVREKIDEKLKINSINNVFVHPVGLGNTHESLPYTPPQSINTGTGSFANTLQGSNSIKLPVCIGDDYIADFKLPEPNFIKMDIEGFEAQALQGLKHTLVQCRPIVFFEWSALERGSHINPATLFPNQYDIFSFIAEQPFLGVFNRKNYKLYIENAPYSDGNKVAIPKEQRVKLENHFVVTRNKKN